MKPPAKEMPRAARSERGGLCESVKTNVAGVRINGKFEGTGLRARIATAKTRLPLPALLVRLDLGEHAKKCARCPLHDDHSPSFSVWQNDRGEWKWKCHAGCGRGDEISFLEKLRGITPAAAIREFFGMAGVQR